MKGILCGFLILVLSSGGLCIQCYKCTSLSLSDTTFSEVCTDEKFNASVVAIDHCNKRCIKFVAEGKNLGAVHRGCFPMPTENGCNEGIMFNQNGKVCYCDTDLCNGAASPDLLCYDCKYMLLGGIGFGAKECSDDFFNGTALPKQKCAGSCSTFKAHVSGTNTTSAVIRGCTPLKSESKCQNGTLSAMVGEYCFCNGDRCNDAQFIRLNIIQFFFSWLLIAGIYFM